MEYQCRLRGPKLQCGRQSVSNSSKHKQQDVYQYFQGCHQYNIIQLQSTKPFFHWLKHVLRIFTAIIHVSHAETKKIISYHISRITTVPRIIPKLVSTAHSSLSSNISSHPLSQVHITPLPPPALQASTPPTTRISAIPATKPSIPI